MEMTDYIYLDNAATTAVDPLVKDAMAPFMTSNYANPSGTYHNASLARSAINKARAHAAALIGADPDEIYFTSGGTESDNMALHGIALANMSRDREVKFNVVSDTIEHPAVYNTLEAVKKAGFVRLDLVSPDSDGFIRPEDIEEAVKKQTKGKETPNLSVEEKKNGLISVMSSNNEVGSINNIADIGAVAAKYGYLFHTDAVQSFGHVLLDVDVMGVDLLSASAHKLGGPKGVGLLYMRRGIKLWPALYGGGQERGLRSGTENVAGIVGFGEACRLAGIRMSADTRYIHELRDRLVYRILNEIPDAKLTGPQIPDQNDKRLPGHCSFAFKGVQGSSLVIGLDIKNICASTGAACSAAANRPSRVLKEIGLGADWAAGSLRLTLSRNNTIEEIDAAVDAVKATVFQLRQMFGDN